MSPQKSTKLNQGPPASEQRLPSKRDQVQTMASTVLDVVGNVAKASDMLAPLKAVCRTTNSVIDIKHASREIWTSAEQQAAAQAYNLSE
ncbi:hypothetical protein PIIN_10357 [Serendipita indica DSM 11827]|uniref:Uncharacterized protein n=1 Tax=Serendipita indica (strain DSM 11827) TaxID=1109443 RepID=G4TYH1_SERID|nr:hypothetical protein PIIN_10357 [Serendipita indica DSM 11827]